MNADCQKINDWYQKLLTGAESYKRIYLDKTKRDEALNLKGQLQEFYHGLKEIVDEKNGVTVQVPGGWVKFIRASEEHFYILKNSFEEEMDELGGRGDMLITPADEKAPKILSDDGTMIGFHWEDVKIMGKLITAPSIARVKEALKHCRFGYLPGPRADW